MMILQSRNGVLDLQPTAVDVVSSRKAILSSRKLQAEDQSSVQCASNYGTSSICCGQAGTPSTPVHQCPSNYPTCTDYVLDSHWGTCVSAETKKPMPSKITVAAYCLNHEASLNTCKSLVASPEFATVLQNDIRTRCAALNAMAANQSGSEYWAWMRLHITVADDIAAVQQKHWKKKEEEEDTSQEQEWACAFPPCS